MRRRDEVMSCDIQELEASLRQQEVVREQETPAEEIARLKEASMDDHINMDREVGWVFKNPFHTSTVILIYPQEPDGGLFGHLPPASRFTQAQCILNHENVNVDANLGIY